MRLSNIFIYGSVCIIVAASVGFLIFKSFTPETGEESTAVAARVLELEQENQALLDQSGEAIQKFSEKITSLHEDLRRSSKLLTEKDLEIINLRERVGADAVSTQLASMLNCDPSQIGASVSQLISNHLDLQQRFQVVSNQLSHQMSNQNANKDPSKAGKGDESAQKKIAQNGDEDKNVEPRIKKLELNAPANQWANGAQNQPPEGSGDKKGSPTQPPPAKESDASGAIVKNLRTEIEDLKADLRNREKLLFEQTSLIEELKKKSRVETGLRTESSGFGTIRTVQPFQDRGTFQVQSPR